MSDRDKIIEEINEKQEQLAAISSAYEAIERVAFGVEVEDEIGIESARYPWSETIEEDRRTFIFETMANSDIGGDFLVSNMHLVEIWLKTGEVPEKQVKKGSHLRAVSSE